jgi:hypothetical protein
MWPWTARKSDLGEGARLGDILLGPFCSSKSRKTRYVYRLSEDWNPEQGVKMALDDSATGNLRGHRRILGLCWVGYGILRLIMGIILILFSGTATVMFGALLSRVPNPFALMDYFHIVYTGIIVLSFVCGVFGILAGLALLADQRPGRMLGLIAALLSLSEIPLGTTLGVYTLVVLLP